MSNKILLSALNVGLESVDTPIDELYEDMAQTSADLTIEQSIEAEREIDEFSERLDIVRGMVESTPEDAPQEAMESLSRLIDHLNYGRTDVSSLEGLDTAGTRQALLAQIDTMKASLESALVVSQESWSVKDLWDSAGTVERLSGELKEVTSALSGRAKWFSENGIVIDSLGQLRFMTVNEAFATNLAKEATTTVEHVTDMIDVADQARDTAAKITALVKSAKVESEGDGRALLTKVVALNNPAIKARQRLDGVHLLNNERAQFELYSPKDSSGVDLKGWDQLGYYSLASQKAVKHEYKASRWARFPAWLVAYDVGNAAAGAITGGAGIVGFGVGVGIGLAAGNAATSYLNDRKAGKAIKHTIKFAEIKAALDKASDLGTKTAQRRRQLPGVFKKAVAGRDETIRAVDALIKQAATAEDRAALKTVRLFYNSCERTSWVLDSFAHRIMGVVISNFLSIGKKMLKASDK